MIRKDLAAFGEVRILPHRPQFQSLETITVTVQPGHPCAGSGTDAGTHRSPRHPVVQTSEGRV